MTRFADPIRQAVAEGVAARGLSLVRASRMLGRNDAFLQQYLHRRSPGRLDEADRYRLAVMLQVDERRLGARDPYVPVTVESIPSPPSPCARSHRRRPTSA
jgi:predicted transcriptional regulator